MCTKCNFPFDNQKIFLVFPWISSASLQCYYTLSMKLSISHSSLQWEELFNECWSLCKLSGVLK